MTDGREKRLVGDVRVMLREDFITQLHHLDAANQKSLDLEAGEDLPGQVF